MVEHVEYVSRFSEEPSLNRWLQVFLLFCFFCCCFLDIYIRTLWSTFARQSGHVARDCWQEEQEQRWPQGKKMMSHWKKKENQYIFYLSWFGDYYVSKYEKRHLPLEADDALSGLESLNGSGGLDVLGGGGGLHLPTTIPGLVILRGGACRALLWTCDLFHFINCGLQSRTTFWTEAISQAIADLCVWLFDLFYCLSNCGAL